LKETLFYQDRASDFLISDWKIDITPKTIESNSSSLVYSPRVENPVNQIILGDCLECLKILPDASISCVVTDPPYGLGNKATPSNEEILAYISGKSNLDLGGDFMGHDWHIPSVAVWKECYRVLKPGGHLLSFAGSRTFDLVSVGIRVAGFENRDTVASFFGSQILSWVQGCLSEDTEILVDGKWELYSPSLLGKKALCYDPAEDTYSWGEVEDTFVYDYDDTAFRIQSVGTDQIVSRGHRCLIEQGGTYIFKEAEGLPQEVCVPVLESLQGLLDNLCLPQLTRDSSKGLLFPRLCKDFVKQVKIINAAPSRGEKRTFHYLRRLFKKGLETCGLVTQNKKANLFSIMQWKASWARFCKVWVQRISSRDPRRSSFCYSKNDGARQSFLERWSDLLSQAWKLQTYQVCSMSSRVYSDGTQGRVCDGTPFDSSSNFKALLIENGNCASCQPQSSSTEPTVVRVQSGSQTVRASRYTISDLAQVSSFHLKGKVWCVQVPTGAFVARRNGKIFITGNSGFPKSLNVEKAMLKAGVAPEIAAKYKGLGTALKPSWEPILVFRKPLEEKTIAAQVLKTETGGLNIDACRVITTDTYQYLNGPGGKSYQYSSNKRSAETRPNSTENNPLGRWPANLVFIHSPGCKIVGFKKVPAPVINRFEDGMKPFGEGAGHGFTSEQTGDADGMEEIPVYECEEGCPVKLLDEQSGELQSGRVKSHYMRNVMGGGGYQGGFGVVPLMGYGDKGGASRFFGQIQPDAPFFYCGKVSPAERNKGLVEKDFDSSNFVVIREDLSEEDQEKLMSEWPSDLTEPDVPIEKDRVPGNLQKFFTGIKQNINFHPTLKPLKLIEWLVKLVAPKGSTVLDPFCGSGTTCIAALNCDCQYIGVEKDPKFYDLAVRRIEGLILDIEEKAAKRGQEEVFDLMLDLPQEDVGK